MSRIAYLDKGLSFGPIILKRVIEQVDPSRYDERQAPDRFTIREIAAHMADFEPVVRIRMETARSHSGSGISFWDEDQQAISKDYGSWDVTNSLNIFFEERLKTHALFKSLSDDELQRSVIHPVLGTLTIWDIAIFVLGHDTYHIEQVSEFMA